MSEPHFDQMRPIAPDPTAVEAEYGEITKAFDAAGDAVARRAALERWDDLRGRLGTWHALAQCRFTLDTRDEEARAERERADELEPRFESLEVGFLRRLLRDDVREELAASFGDQAVALWRNKVRSFDPRIEEDTVEESRLGARYTALLSSAEIEFRGDTYNLSGLARFAEDPDRATRRAATEKRAGWFSERAEELDTIYDELTRRRAAMARTLGYPDFVAMGYDRMARIDYGRAEVERFRAGVREHVVPLCEAVRARQKDALGVDRLAVYDEPVHDPSGNPKPDGGHDWMMERATAMFSETGHGLGDFFAAMRARGLLDLETREGKAPGGYCTFFEEWGVPFIFANFNGTKHDVKVFMHEVGHAFQGYESRALFPTDYRYPTMDACEIHSMALEFLLWPHMEKFFGDDADRFRRLHLQQGLLFLPYGVAVDHFQHLVYDNPGASPAERHAMWKEMERLYLPWRDNAGIGHLEKGGRWQMQLHVYRMPFYYIDYTLAQVCALQFHARAESDRDEAMEGYVELCRRGGSAPFQELVRGAGLRSPFDDGVLRDVVEHASAPLGI